MVALGEVDERHVLDARGRVVEAHARLPPRAVPTVGGGADDDGVTQHRVQAEEGDVVLGEHRTLGLHAFRPHAEAAILPCDGALEHRGGGRLVVLHEHADAPLPAGPARGVGDVVAERAERQLADVHVHAGAQARGRVREVVPEPVSVGARRGVLHQVVGRVGDPERRRGVVGLEDPLAVLGSAGRQAEVAPQRVAHLDPVLEEVAVPLRLVPDGVAHLDVVAAVDGQAAVEGVVNRRAAHVAAGGAAHHVEVDRVPGEPARLAEPDELRAGDVKHRSAEDHHVAALAGGPGRVGGTDADVAGQVADLAVLGDGRTGELVGLTPVGGREWLVELDRAAGHGDDGALLGLVGVQAGGREHHAVADGPAGGVLQLQPGRPGDGGPGQPRPRVVGGVSVDVQRAALHRDRAEPGPGDLVAFARVQDHVDPAGQRGLLGADGQPALDHDPVDLDRHVHVGDGQRPVDLDAAQHRRLDVEQDRPVRRDGHGVPGRRQASTPGGGVRPRQGPLDRGRGVAGGDRGRHVDAVDRRGRRGRGVRTGGDVAGADGLLHLPRQGSGATDEVCGRREATLAVHERCRLGGVAQGRGVAQQQHAAGAGDGRAGHEGVGPAAPRCDPDRGGVALLVELLARDGDGGVVARVARDTVDLAVDQGVGGRQHGVGHRSGPADDGQGADAAGGDGLCRGGGQRVVGGQEDRDPEGGSPGRRRQGVGPAPLRIVVGPLDQQPVGCVGGRRDLDGDRGKGCPAVVGTDAPDRGDAGVEGLTRHRRGQLPHQDRSAGPEPLDLLHGGVVEGVRAGQQDWGVQRGGEGCSGQRVGVGIGPGQDDRVAAVTVGGA